MRCSLNWQVRQFVPTTIPRNLPIFNWLGECRKPGLHFFTSPPIAAANETSCAWRRIDVAAKKPGKRMRPVYETGLGRMYSGLAEEVLALPALKSWRGRVQMLFTSPPFPLQREKKYGNLQGDAFAGWLAGFARLFSEMLTADGSIVIELGNGWNPGVPTMSTTSLKALVA